MWGKPLTIVGHISISLTLAFLNCTKRKKGVVFLSGLKDLTYLKLFALTFRCNHMRNNTNNKLNVNCIINENDPMQKLRSLCWRSELCWSGREIDLEREGRYCVADCHFAPWRVIL